MEELFTLANKLGGLSFATLLVLILYGSWRDIWRWGKDYRALQAEKDEMEADYERRLADIDTAYSARIARMENSIDKWQNVAMIATGVSETVTRELQRGKSNA